MSIRQGPVQFYDRSVVDVLSTWAQNRHPLTQDLMHSHTSNPVARVTLARALSYDPGSTSANVGHERELDNHMHMCIVIQSVFAWDESIRQRSSNFYDRSQRYIMDAWTQKHKLLLQVLSGESST